MKIKAGLEGAVKFNQNIINLQARMPDITELNAWRDILYGAELIGQNIVDGKEVGYGNVSQLLRPYNAGNNNKRFVITGTQTGKYSQLFKENYSIVLGYYPGTNSVDIQEGTADASSESMTHGTLYDIDENVRFVFHVHSPEIWKNAGRLGILRTRDDVEYGTPKMVEEVERLFRETDVREKNIFATGGHKDGIFSFGNDPRITGSVLLYNLIEAGKL